MDSLHACTLYQKYFEINLWPLSEDGFPLPSKQVGVLQIHFNGPAIEALEIAKRDIEEAIEQAKQNPW